MSKSIENLIHFLTLHPIIKQEYTTRFKNKYTPVPFATLLYSSCLDNLLVWIKDESGSLFIFQVSLNRRYSVSEADTKPKGTGCVVRAFYFTKACFSNSGMGQEWQSFGGAGHFSLSATSLSSAKGVQHKRSKPADLQKAYFLLFYIVPA